MATSLLLVLYLFLKSFQVVDCNNFDIHGEKRDDGMGIRETDMNIEEDKWIEVVENEEEVNFGEFFFNLFIYLF